MPRCYRQCNLLVCAKLHTRTWEWGPGDEARSDIYIYIGLSQNDHLWEEGGDCIILPSHH